MANLDTRLEKLEKMQRSEAQDSGWAARLLHDLERVYGAEGDQVETILTPAGLRQSISETLEKVYHDGEKEP